VFSGMSSLTSFHLTCRRDSALIHVEESCLWLLIGFISPFVLERILQEICKRGVSWDDPIPNELLPRWNKWKSDMAKLKEIRIPRCYKPTDFGPVIRTELHHFSDASTDGYGVCSYLRFISDDRIYGSLAVSKAIVSPTKVVTIPRLELTAASNCCEG